MFCQIYFNEHCLVNNNISIPKIVINLYIFYILNPRLSKLNTDFALKNCLFGSVKLTKNADLDKWAYSGYGIGVYSCSEFSFTNGSMGKNKIISGTWMSSSVDIDNKKKYILILDERPTQWLDDTTLPAEAKFPINFTQPRFVLSWHYNRSKFC